MAGCSQEAVIEALRARGAWANTGTTWTPEEQEQARKRSEIAKAERVKADQEKHTKAAQLARNIYDAANVLETSTHDYVLTKRLTLGDLVRRGVWAQRGWKDALLFPIYASDRSITSIQAINTDGGKDFLEGGKIKGCFYPIGTIKGITGQIFIGEGIATVAAVVHVMGGPGVAALNAGNLEAVAREIKTLAPAAEIIILADDDQKEGCNESRN
jgi:putative DNA primase/helicase